MSDSTAGLDRRAPHRFYLKVMAAQSLAAYFLVAVIALIARVLFVRYTAIDAGAVERLDFWFTAFFVAAGVVLFVFWAWLRNFSDAKWAKFEDSMACIQQDLSSQTEKLLLERAGLSTIMSAISDAVLAVDNEGTPLFFNRKLVSLVNESEDEFRRKKRRLWEMFRDPDILAAFGTALKEAKTGFSRSISAENGIDAKSYYSLSVSPLIKPTGEVFGALGIFHDITELKAAEQMRIDFVANVSHELRTPLTAIKGYTDTLIDDAEQGRKLSADFLRVISRNSDRLIALVEDLLELSSLESTDLMKKTKLSTQELTSAVVKQFERGCAAKQQNVMMNCDATFVFADAKRIEQVLVNLLDNANKYTPIGGSITIDWSKEKPVGQDTVLRVSDTGPGIPAEFHQRLFERFYRIDQARSRDEGGTGLGLAIVKHIMQRHGGTVSIESSVEKGTTFVCRFPGENT